MSRAHLSATAYHYPSRVLNNEELAGLFPQWSPEQIFKKLGIEERRIAAADEYASDLAACAAQRLFTDHAIDPRSIDFLLFCTQTPDYLLPTSACMIHHALGLRSSAGALDFNLGCSGYIYGLSLAKGLIESGQAGAVLLVTADTYSKLLRPDDSASRTVFGDAGSATLVRCEADSGLALEQFVFGTDGTGAAHLMCASGGMRAQQQGPSSANGLTMNGPEIFAFAAREVPALVHQLLGKANLALDDVDLFVFHQANKHMLEHLRTKCGIPAGRFATHYSKVGNTVSSTIPIALSHALRERQLAAGATVMLVGFGVGLSWGSCILRMHDTNRK